MFCSNCGGSLEAGVKFCPNCGQKISFVAQSKSDEIPEPDPLEPRQQQDSSQTNSIRDENAEQQNILQNNSQDKRLCSELVSNGDFKRLVYAYITHDDDGKVENFASRHYYNAFYKIRNTNEALGWNWSAFLVGGFNFIYRKSYVAGIAFIIFGLILGFILAGLSENIFTTALNFAVCGAAGAYGDKIHYNRFILKLKEAQAQYPRNVTEQCRFLAHC